jgi:hypothetical protein
MVFDKELWLRDSFSSKNKVPNWFCPICWRGILQKESIATFNTVETNKAASLFYETDALAEFRFAGYLKCNNCSERVVMSGIGKYRDTVHDTDVRATYRGKRYSVFFPRHFEPELLMFRLANDVKIEIKTVLTKSFNLFWYDLESCANKIRQAIELVVIEKSATGKSLDNKIESLRTSLGDNLTNTLLALKWIGNEGSHIGRPFERHEIVEAFCLMEDVLKQLYPDNSEAERKQNLVALINSNKGLKKS